MPTDAGDHGDPLSGAAAARVSSFRQAYRDAAPGMRAAIIARTVSWLSQGAAAEERDAVLRALLTAVATSGGVEAGGGVPASSPASASSSPSGSSSPPPSASRSRPEPSPAAPAAAARAASGSSTAGGPRTDDLLHDTWSQLGGTSADVDMQRLAGVARAACFAFLMEIDEFAAKLYGQLNYDEALLDGSLRDRIAEYLNQDESEADPESLLRLIRRRRTAVLYLLHLAGTAGWVFWQDIVRDRLSPERLESASPRGNGKGGKAGPGEAAWAAYREMFATMNSKEQLDALWLGTARTQISRLFGAKG